MPIGQFTIAQWRKLTSWLNDGILPAQAKQSSKVYNDATLSLPSGTTYTIPFNRDLQNNNSIHNTSSNTSRLTCQRPDMYIITGNINISANATGVRDAYINLNGGTRIAEQRGDDPNNAGARISIVTIYPLASGDYVELQVFQNSGATLNILPDSNRSPYFAIMRGC